MRHIPRLFVNGTIMPRTEIVLAHDQMHHLVKVLRLKEGDEVHVFNNLSGEWRCSVKSVKNNTVFTEDIIRLPMDEFGPSVACALIHPAKFSILAEKITELGVREIFPIITEYTQYKSFNRSKIEKIITQACEQSERLSVPILHDSVRLSKFLEAYPRNRRLLVGSAKESPDKVIHVEKDCDFLIGPEGGFSEREFEIFSACSFVKLFHLGRNILRSETAAIASVAFWSFSVNS